MISIWNPGDSEIDSHHEQPSTQQQICTLKFCKYKFLTIKNLTYFSENASTVALRIEPTTFVWHDPGITTMVTLYCDVTLRRGNFVIYRETDYRSNLAKTILFENCSSFSKIPFSISEESPRIFQGLISIPAGHWVRQIVGKSSAIYLANSFCQLYSALWSAWQEDPNDAQERCAMARINFACEFAICS